MPELAGEETGKQEYFLFCVISAVFLSLDWLKSSGE